MAGSAPTDPDFALTEAGPEALDGAAQLRRELNLLELRLRREVLVSRAERGSGRSDEFAGLYIPDEEIDRYLKDTEAAAPPPDELRLLDQRIEAEVKALSKAAALGRVEGKFLPIEHLREAFSLRPGEISILLACLAPDLDLRFERYYAYLQNDVARKRPCVQLLGRLFLEDPSDYATLRYLFASGESLVGQRLLETSKVAGDAGFAALQPKVPEGLLDFLLEGGSPDPDLKGLGIWREGRNLVSPATYLGQHRALVKNLVLRAERDGRLPFAFIRGPEGCGKEDLVLALAQGLSARVLECEAEELLAFAGDWGEWLKVLERDLRLRTGFVWIRHAEAWLMPGEAARAKLRQLGVFLRERFNLNLIMTAERGPAELRSHLGLELMESALAAPDSNQRLELWRGATGQGNLGVAEAGIMEAGLLEALASKFRFGPGKINAVVEALRRSRIEGSGGEDPGAEASLDAELHRACREESNRGLGSFAQKLEPKYRWEDLVVPADILAQLREIRNSVRHRQRVYGEWGFEGKFSLGKGLNVLFSGPSGTGKTMSTEILAGDLGLDLYKIDLASVVSKYIGETEKNLARIFREAQSGNCILLFDEADALFGKRSEVKDSHDRYANIEINYLLQRMEEYDGIVILTTNMSKNLDAAFTRRIQYTVEFPFPDERQREELWRKVFPAATPLAADMDLDFLAKRFKFSGANIKNIALNGAFMAASNGGVVDMAHIVTALKREYRKLGKLCSRSEFGPYYGLVRDEEEPGRGNMDSPRFADGDVEGDGPV